MAIGRIRLQPDIAVIDESRQRVATGMHNVREALSPCAVIEALVNRPHRRPCLFREGRVGHVEEGTPSTRITPRHSPRIDVNTVIPHRPIEHLFPLGHECDLPRCRAPHMVNESDFVVRQGAQETLSSSRCERTLCRWRETQTIQGIGNLGIEATRSQKTRIACPTAIKESPALRAKGAISKPAHNDGGIDDECGGGHEGYGSRYPASRAFMSSSTGSGRRVKSTP